MDQNNHEDFQGPDPDDFDDYSDYVEARIDHKVEQQLQRGQDPPAQAIDRPPATPEEQIANAYPNLSDDDLLKIQKGTEFARQTMEFAEKLKEADLVVDSLHEITIDEMERLLNWPGK